ncbi:aminoglycoside phosphotransferase family protein, partial [Candidatus Woesearchaeota archaeon]|nr:aminoglycoside phosphotransferase family protein [Candidatus Woesearchaeota archaeon]
MAEDNNLIRKLLGRRSYGKLVDKFLLKRLLGELVKKKKSYDSVRQHILDGDYDINEETTYVMPDFRAGRLVFSIPGSDFCMSSFYRVGFSKEKRGEIAKDYDICSFLTDNGIDVPSTIFTSGRFSATELIEGRELVHELQEPPSRKKRRRLVGQIDSIVEQVFSYNALERIPRKVRKALDADKLSSLYDINKLLEATGSEDAELCSEVAEGWAKSIDDVLAGQHQGLIHSDLHNENIIVNGAGAKIIDFGDATMGPVHYDICRLLMSTGNFNQYSDGEPVPDDVRKMLDRRVVSAGYDLKSFYSMLNRAHASTHMRLAASTFRKVKKLMDHEYYDEVLSSEDKKLVENLASYHFTQAIDSLDREGLHGLGGSFRKLGEAAGLNYRSREWMRSFIESQDPDISGWSNFKRVMGKLGLLDRQKTMQEADIRKMARGRLARTVSAVVAAGALLVVAGVGAYNKLVTPAADALAEKQRIAAYLADNHQVDMSNRSFVFMEPEENGRRSADIRVRVMPNSLSYLFHSANPKLPSLFRQFVKDNPQVPLLFDMKSCIDSKESSAYCDRTLLVSVDEHDNWWHRTADAFDKSISTKVADRSALAEAISPFDYFKGVPGAGLLESHERIFFRLQGVLRALKHAHPEAYRYALRRASVPLYTGSDEKMQSLLLAQRIAEHGKESGNLAFAYLKVLCSPDELKLAGNDLEGMLLGSQDKIAGRPLCADVARDAYFALLRMNNLDPESVDLILNSPLRKSINDILRSKDIFIPADVGQDVAESIVRVNMLSLDVVAKYLQFRIDAMDALRPVSKHYIKLLESGKQEGDHCDSPLDSDVECEFNSVLAVNKSLANMNALFNYLGLFMLNSAQYSTYNS